MPTAPPAPAPWPKPWPPAPPVPPPPGVRPPPGPPNIGGPRDAAWHAGGPTRAGSLAEALAACPPGTDAWVIGGAQIYAAALPLADTAVVTEIARDFEGDAFAPVFGPEWKETTREAQVSANGLPFAFVTYTRQP